MRLKTYGTWQGIKPTFLSPLSRALGAKVDLLSPAMLKRRFPWLNVDDIALGSLGMENEGHFDPWALLTMLKMKCQDLGVTFVHGDVYNFAHDINHGSEFDFLCT